MSIRWYRTFLAVSRTGSFAAAAREVGLTQAAVSIQMRSLEERLCIDLFDRGARTVALTGAGRALAARAQELVRIYDGIGQGLDGERLGGVLALGAIHHTFSRLLPDALLALRRAHPEIVVHVCNGVSNELMRKVEQGELDAAIVSQPPFRLARNLVWHTIVAEPLALVTPRAVGARGLARTLATHPFIGVSRESWTGHLTHALIRRHRLEVDEVMALNSIEAIAGMVARGFGVAILPLSGYVDALGRRVDAAILSEPQVDREIGLIHRRDAGPAALVMALLESLSASVRKGRPVRRRRIAIGS